MRLVFVGPPGSGKGTQAKLLHERLGLTTIGTGDMFREAVAHKTPVGSRVESYIHSGKLVPDDLVIELVAELFRSDNHPTRFVLDGFPRTLAQAVALEAILRQNHLDLKAVLKFEIPDEEIVERLGGRRMTQGRSDDGEETVRKRLRIYHDYADSLCEHYRRQGLLAVVDATADVETVYRTIVTLSKG
ncbi:MAG: adenylate kinase [Gemmataceae bacterium]